MEALISERLDHWGGRHAMVLVTDGTDVGSGWATADTAIKRLRSSNVPLYVIRYNAGSDAGWTKANPPWPESLGRNEFARARLGERASAFLVEAGASGGHVFETSTREAGARERAAPAHAKPVPEDCTRAHRRDNR